MKTEVSRGTIDLDVTAVEQLTHRERDVFELIGQGLSTSAIATCLCLAPSTIETYRERMKTKLNLSTGLELNRFAILWFARDMFQRPEQKADLGASHQRDVSTCFTINSGIEQLTTTIRPLT